SMQMPASGRLSVLLVMWLDMVNSSVLDDCAETTHAASNRTYRILSVISFIHEKGSIARGGCSKRLRNR
ncbi:MAG: hypothetical protein ACREXY_22370, partial [Gammaproteobacteria bacterium]